MVRGGFRRPSWLRLLTLSIRRLVRIILGDLKNGLRRDTVLKYLPPPLAIMFNRTTSLLWSCTLMALEVPPPPGVILGCPFRPQLSEHARSSLSELERKLRDQHGAPLPFSVEPKVRSVAIAAPAPPC